MDLRERLIRFHFILSSQVGIDLIKMYRFLKRLPRFFHDFLIFKSNYSGVIEIVPCLHDWYEEGGSTSIEYFWQDLLVAQRIFDENPDVHVDIGSRIDGFVAHVASFRPIEVFDVRPVKDKIPNVEFKQADLMESLDEFSDYCDSLSCLHSLEHFGLGRYGDRVDPDGYKIGFTNIAKLLRNNGSLYLSVPIGNERVEFNANRVFDPLSIIENAELHGFKFDYLISIKNGRKITYLFDLTEIKVLADERYALGIFIFKKQPIEI